MRLPRLTIWVLTFVYVLCFAGFVVASVLAFASNGYITEYEHFGIALPTVLTALLTGMVISSALPWAHFKKASYTHFEETFFGALMGIAVFGLILAIPLMLTA